MRAYRTVTVSLVDGQDFEAEVEYEYTPGQPSYRGFNNVIEPPVPPSVEILEIAAGEDGEDTDIIDLDDVANLTEIEVYLIENTED